MRLLVPIEFPFSSSSSIAAGSAPFLLEVISALAASPAGDVGFLPTFPAHTSGSFHFLKPAKCVNVYSGERMVIVSPRTNTVPIFLFNSPLTYSSASSRTTLIWMSKALSFPTYLWPFFRSTKTVLFLAALSMSKGLDASIINYTPIIMI